MSKEPNLLLQASQLVKAFKTEVAVDNLSFEIRKGTCIALLGPNGAGKTTTLNMLSGMLSPTSGTIHFHSELGDVRSNVGFLPQVPQMFGWLTAGEFLKLCGELQGMDKKKLKDRIERVLAFVGLMKVNNKRIAGFSGGMKQRLGLAQAILHEPPLLILDEPVSALDPTGRKEVLELIREMKKERTIIFSTHILHDAEQVCDEVLIMQEGILKWNGTLIELKKTLRKPYITIKTAQSLKGLLENIKGVEKVDYVSDNEVKIQVTDHFDTQSLILKITDEHLELLSFNADEATLEDAYMEVLKR
ncbi:ATP-binding cassette domain-containing protein [Alkalihalobacillus trypoxylicola]|uniref:Multidrug ABC transporter ATP-binding protein n=1 Tax=Alkalihalobacillus trypoxylicola TaxID=519424 RepID=A0A162D0G7_9BACI|nr:ABC transporter ATP-binding protein [Alkalihalobacillus trypoxylicola]KYG27591.1 multidrug ABC transporter ATP-binding protein [Alkalihalobacillus trypoxylicola]